jgi:alpha-tubulin suppressor-like RCC1 family protein
MASEPTRRTSGRLIGWSVAIAAVAALLLAWVPARQSAEAFSGAPAALISAGGSDTCLVNSGAAWCQGLNANGQLGNNSTVSSAIPVPVSGLGSNVSAIAVGDAHACAVQNGGAVCWGLNTYGQLGDNSTLAVHTPTAVSGLTSGVVAIAAGTDHTCALTAAGAVWCWGLNNYGQLGDGTTTNSSVPVAVPTLSSGVTAISAGGNASCAIQGGAAACWGSDFLDLASYPNPAIVSGLSSGVSAIAVGNNHVCAVQSGEAWCWGRNNGGELGNNSLTSSAVPVAVTNLSTGVTAISAGKHAASNQEQSCAIQNGGAWCWGGNFFGQLGNTSTTNSPVPVAVSGFASGVTALASGDSHTCALTTSGGGGAFCWGWNSDGQVGNAAAAGCATGGGPGTAYSCSLVPVPVASPGIAETVDAIASGGDAACALTAGSAWCWGENNSGQLGSGSSTLGATNVAFSVASLGSGVSAIAVGNDHACAIQNGGAWCWGGNNGGQLGNNSLTGSAVPVAVTNLGSGVTEISAGDHTLSSQEHSCAIQNGGVWCWGANWDGQLGNNSTTNSPIPVAVSGLASGVMALASGDSHTCALTTAGAVWCWGNNADGQLGDGTTTNSSIPLAVPGMGSGVTAIAAGAFETCAIQAGSAKCWGDNAHGQLGNNNTTNSSSPVAVSGLMSGVTSIAVGGSNATNDGHACAVQNGGAWCWGYNFDGQLGDNSTLPVDVPVAVFGLGSGVASVSAGFGHSCALTTTGITWCWGLNNFGQVGDNMVPDSHIPAGVLGLPHPAPPSVTGPAITAGTPTLVGTASVSTGTITVPILASGGGFSPYDGFNLHLRWASSVFRFSTVDMTSSIINSPFCAGPIADGDGGGVTFGCTSLNGPTGGTGLLATVVLRPLDTGCSNIHVFTLAGVDSGDAGSASYTTDSVSLYPQLNTYSDNAAGWAGQSGCAPDTDGDGYPDTTDPNPNSYCPIMRADVDGDGQVTIVDLSTVAQDFLQSVPSAPARYDQDGDGQITIVDLGMMAQDFLQPVTACP